MTTDVQVCVRVRPFHHHETPSDCLQVGPQDVRFAPWSGSTLLPRQYPFHHCFTSTDENHPQYRDQQGVYADVGVSLVDRIFDGFNVCLLAYGQTGSGKTHTMMGPNGGRTVTGPERGVVPRLCEDLFTRMASLQASGRVFKLEASFYELYNESVRDLLTGADGLATNWTPEDGFGVAGLSEHRVKDVNALLDVMQRGALHRTTAATDMNDLSSRSHAVFTIQFMELCVADDSLPTDDGGRVVAARRRLSHVTLVDLAGSERLSRSGSEGKRLKEAQHINKSLACLGDVIQALASQSVAQSRSRSTWRSHIPYRNSLLTKLLETNIGGNSKTVMIATISPTAADSGETLSTLSYANRMAFVENDARVNEGIEEKDVSALQREMADMQLRVDSNVRKLLDEYHGRLLQKEEEVSTLQRTVEELQGEALKAHEWQIEAKEWQLQASLQAQERKQLRRECKELRRVAEQMETERDQALSHTRSGDIDDDDDDEYTVGAAPTRYSPAASAASSAWTDHNTDPPVKVGVGALGAFAVAVCLTMDVALLGPALGVLGLLAAGWYLGRQNPDEPLGGYRLRALSATAWSTFSQRIAAAAAATSPVVVVRDDQPQYNDDYGEAYVVPPRSPPGGRSSWSSPPNPSAVILPPRAPSPGLVTASSILPQREGHHEEGWRTDRTTSAVWSGGHERSRRELPPWGGGSPPRMSASEAVVSSPSSYRRQQYTTGILSQEEGTTGDVRRYRTRRTRSVGSAVNVIHDEQQQQQQDGVTVERSSVIPEWYRQQRFGGGQTTAPRSTERYAYRVVA